MDVAQYMNNGYSFTRNFINKTTSSKIVEAITSDAADKILKKKYGSFSDNVFKFYTKEITRTTKGSNKCPVDIYIYDSNGTLCGYVVDNKATVLNDAIKLTCEGDAKYWELSGDNYYITAVGNGDGKMKYEVSEYQNSELVRTITYNDIPLETGLSYTSMVPYAVMSDSGVYNVVSLEDGNPQTMTSDESYTKDDVPGSDEPETKLVDSGTCGDNLGWVYYDNGLLEITGSGKMADYSPWYKYKSSIKTIKLSKSLESIGKDAFRDCTGLTSITIPDSVTRIGDYAFCDCTGLMQITIPESVTSIGDVAFYGCTGLTSVTIPESVTSIGGSAFSGCTGLTQITIPESVTSIGVGAFSGCTGLTQITIPESVTSIGDFAFYGCTGLTSITIPESVTNIGYAFRSCTGLTSVTYNAINCIMSNYYYVFENCTNLTKVTIGEKVETIPNYAFRPCQNLDLISKICYNINNL